MVGTTRDKSVPENYNVVEVMPSLMYRKPELPLIRQWGITASICTFMCRDVICVFFFKFLVMFFTGTLIFMGLCFVLLQLYVIL